MWEVCIFNHDAACGFRGVGRTRRIAFESAMRAAGEPFLRYKGDKATTLRTLFDHGVKHNRWCEKYASERRNNASLTWEKA